MLGLQEQWLMAMRGNLLSCMDIEGVERICDSIPDLIPFRLLWPFFKNSCILMNTIGFSPPFPSTRERYSISVVIGNMSLIKLTACVSR